MGFTVYYTATKPLSPELEQEIEKAAGKLSDGYSWLSSEPVGFFGKDEDDRLIGGSKPAFGERHPEDVAEAEASGLPDGTPRTVIEILCRLSRQFHVDWEIAHDGDPEVPGLITDGACDAELEAMMNEIIAMQDDIS